MSLLVLYVGAALSISFLCSLLEATLLSARLTELTERQRAGDRGAAILLEIKQHRIDDAISAILTLNTIAHTVGAALAGAQAAAIWGDRWVGVFSGVLTLLVLIGSEIIPKTLGAVHASRLVGFVARTLALLTRALKPALVLTRLLTQLLSRGAKQTISRGELAALVAMAARQGTLGGPELQVLLNALRFEEIRVEDVMTPRTVAVMLPVSATLRELIENREVQPFSRIPVYEDDPDQVIGYVLVREVLRAAARGADLDRPIGDFKRKVLHLPETASIAQALRQILEPGRHLAMVTDEFGGVNGLVTLEDLMETILGAEIVDEYDRVIDLRALALERRDRRLKRLQQEIGEGRTGAAAGPQPAAGGEVPPSAVPDGPDEGGAPPPAPEGGSGPEERERRDGPNGGRPAP